MKVMITMPKTASVAVDFEYGDAWEMFRDLSARLIAEMMALVCDNLCHHPKEAGDQESLEEICAECQMGKFVCDILNNYN